jgi:oxygen-dependent protoporphyrinogen oxidase
MSLDAIVVGGGIAGLSAGYELHKRGVRFAILEGAPRAGGVILSEEVDGFTIDAGPDALLRQKPEAIRLCQELGIGDRLVPTRPPRLAYIQRGGRLHALPAASVLGIPTAFAPFIKTPLFSWTGKLRMGAELFVPRRRGAGDESIAQFIGRRFGREAVTYLAEPLLAGIHAGDVNRLSVQALFPRLAQAEQRSGSLLRAFRRQARGAAARSDGAFMSLPGGLSEMVRALVAALPSGAVCVNSPVTAFSGGGGLPFRIETAAGSILEARAVVFSTPAYATGALVKTMDPQLARLCDQVRYASTATIALGFTREAVAHPLNGSGFVVPRKEGTGILAASWLSSKWPHRAPDGRVLLRTFVGGARDPWALSDTDDELIDRSLRAVTPLLGIRADPLLVRVYRFDRTSAQHEVGHLARLGAIERALTRHPGVFVTGSGFRGVGIPDCIGDARATAVSVARFLGIVD